jgi:aspartate racemase
MVAKKKLCVCLAFLFLIATISSTVLFGAVEANKPDSSLEITREKAAANQITGGKKMKVIGLLGGMTWYSSIEYYRLINQMVADRLGEPHSAHVILYSVDFAEIEYGHRKGLWKEMSVMLTDAAKALKAAGADCLVICTNTMHKLADDMEKGSGLPVIHIADVTGEAIKKKGLHKVGLLGSRFTMEEDFYRGRLKKKYGLEVIIPDEADRECVNRVIYDELAVGKLTDSSKQAYIEIINRLVERGAEGIILGCTEIPLLVKPGDVDVPLFDTTRLHAEAAVDFALSGILEP